MIASLAGRLFRYQLHPEAQLIIEIPANLRAGAIDE